MLENYIEETQTLLSDLELFFGAGEKLETIFDNVGASLPFNFKIFGFGAPALWALGPAVALIIVYVPMHIFIEHRYRDSWDAYFTRERDRLDRISGFLNDIKKIVGSNCEKLAFTDENTRNSLKQLVASLEAYEIDTIELENAKKLNAEYWLELHYGNEEDNKKEWLKRMLGSNFYAFYVNLKKQLDEDSPSTPSSAKAISTKQKVAVDIEPELGALQLGALQDEKNKLEGAQKNWDMQFINGSLFNGVLAYGLAYWLVYYFTIEILKPATFAPLSWALLALVFPAVYLMYKEFLTYKKRVLEKNTDEEVAEQQDLQFRLGWVFIALILSISVGNILSFSGFGTIPVLFITAIIFSGFLTVVFGALKIIDLQMSASRSALFTDEDENQAHQKADTPALDRKQHAEARRKLLDESALAAYQLALQCKMGAARNTFKIEPFLNKTNASSIGEVAYSDIEEGVVYSDAEEGENVSIEKPTRGRSAAEMVRLILSVTLSALLGYGLGALLGFVLGDFTGHFTTIFSGTLLNVLGGCFGLVVGALFGRRAYLSEKKHQNQLDILWTQSQAQQDILKTLENTIAGLKYAVFELEKLQRAFIKKLEENLSLSDVEVSRTIESLKKLQFDEFSHPVKREGITLRKVIFVLRAILQLIVAVSTVLLMARALLTMGFAKIIPWLNGSLSLFGSSISPLALVILGFALVLLILKAVNDVYLAEQRHEENYKLDRIDFVISLKEGEKNYLENRSDFLKQSNEKLSQYLETKSGANTPVLSSGKEDIDEQLNGDKKSYEKIYVSTK